MKHVIIETKKLWHLSIDVGWERMFMTDFVELGLRPLNGYERNKNQEFLKCTNQHCIPQNARRRVPSV